MKIHCLKCWPKYYDEVATGRKTFECRAAIDREFQAGDRLLLQAFDPEQQVYTGASHMVDVLAVYHNLPGVLSNHVVMSILDTPPQPDEHNRT